MRVAPGQSAASAISLPDGSTFSTSARGAMQFEGTCSQGRSTTQSGSPCVRFITSIDSEPFFSRVLRRPKLPSMRKAREGRHAASSSNPMLVAPKFSL